MWQYYLVGFGSTTLLAGFTLKDIARFEKHRYKIILGNGIIICIVVVTCLASIIF